MPTAYYALHEINNQRRGVTPVDTLLQIYPEEWSES